LGIGAEARHVSPSAIWTGHIVTFLLAIYGGFFSGGYVTMLTAAFVILFGMTFLQAVATTKVVNVFSSGVASLVFLWRGVVDILLGVILGVVMWFRGVIGRADRAVFERGMAAANFPRGRVGTRGADALDLALVRWASSRAV
jgi:uncharacterized membrane protein YfcA